MKQLIAIAGPAGSGKSTLAHCLKKLASPKEADIISFATPLKKIAKEDFGWDGQKDAPGRKLLQDVGSVARDYTRSFWIRNAATRITNAWERVDIVILDDLRYDNEVTFINSLGGIIVKIEGRGGLSGECANHASERGIGSWDILFDNAEALTGENGNLLPDAERRLYEILNARA